MFRQKLWTTTFIFLIAYFGCALPLSAQEQFQWERINEDLEVLEARISVGSFLSSTLVAFRTSLTQYRLGVIRASDFGIQSGDARTLCKRSRATLCINSNFFDENGNALGLVISKGVRYRGIHQGGSTLTGILSATRSHISIKTRSDFESTAVTEAIQAGPRLLTKGKIIPTNEQHASYSRRSAVCIDQKGNMLIVCTTPAVMGITLEQLQTLLLQKELSCYDALNLDGGGSSQLYYSGSLPIESASPTELSIEGRDPVPVLIGLFKRS